MTVTVGINEAQLKKIKDKLDPKIFTKALDISLARIGLEMETKAKKGSPIDTGTLRRSILTNQGDQNVRVGTNVPYARILDQGGTIPARTVTVKSAKVLTNGVNFFGKSVNIPSRTVRPYNGIGYLTPAFDEQANGRALSIIEKEIENILK